MALFLLKTKFTLSLSRERERWTKLREERRNSQKVTYSMKPHKPIKEKVMKSI